MIGQLELSEPAQPITGSGRSKSRYQTQTQNILGSIQQNCSIWTRAAVAVLRCLWVDVALIGFWSDIECSCNVSTLRAAVSPRSWTQCPAQGSEGLTQLKWGGWSKQSAQHSTPRTVKEEWNVRKTETITNIFRGLLMNLMLLMFQKILALPHLPAPAAWPVAERGWIQN